MTEPRDDDGLDPEDRDGTAVDEDDPIVSPPPDAAAQEGVVEDADNDDAEETEG